MPCIPFTFSFSEHEVLIRDLQIQLTIEQERANAANENLNSLTTEKEHLAQELEKANTLIKTLQNTTQDRQLCIDKSQQTIIDTEVVKVEEMRRNLQEVFDPKPVIGEHIKKILNAVYRLVKLQFEPEYKYDTAFIQSVLAETIKVYFITFPALVFILNFSLARLVSCWASQNLNLKNSLEKAQIQINAGT